MKRLAVELLTCCLALGLCAVVGPAAAQSMVGNKAWQVVEKHGGVRYRAPVASQWSEAAVGAELPFGSRIVTEANGWVLMRHPAGNLWAEPNARFVLPTPDEARVRQEAGHLRYRVHKTEQQRFEVETPYASLVVKGTAFGVRVSDIEVTVDVAHGWVDVTNRAGARADLRAGQAARVSGGATPTLEVRPAPGQGFELVPPDRQARPAIAPAARLSEIAPEDRHVGARGDSQVRAGRSWFERLREMLRNLPPPTPREDWWGAGDGGSGASADSGGFGSGGSDRGSPSGSGSGGGASSGSGSGDSGSGDSGSGDGGSGDGGAGGGDSGGGSSGDGDGDSDGDSGDGDSDGGGEGEED
jgi:hypothetical protein